MIEVVSKERCTQCNICVAVCPMDVFDAVPGDAPTIARQDDCQTCFMCEVNCPDDALYVAPMRAPVAADSPQRDEETLLRIGVIGTYRARLGLGSDRRPPRNADEAFALAEIGPRRPFGP